MPEGGLGLPAIFATSFLVGLSGAMSPGPLLAFTVRESVRRGVVAGPLISSGHALLELGVLALLLVGLGPYLQRPLVAGAIGLAGGLFLLWMAWNIARSPLPAAGLAGAQAGPTPARTYAVAGGLMVTLSNPFWFVWWVTIGLAFLTQATPRGLPGVGAFYTGHILADYAWYTAVSAGVASGRRFLGPRLHRGILLACALFLLGLGAYFLLSGVRLLLPRG